MRLNRNKIYMNAHKENKSFISIGFSDKTSDF